MHTGSENLGLKLETENLEQHVETSDRLEDSEQDEEEEDEEVEEPSSGPSSAPMRSKGRLEPAGSSITAAASSSKPDTERQYCTMTC